MTGDLEGTRVLLVDDHAIVRKGVRALLLTEPEIAMEESSRGQSSCSGR